jgi:hypothetical protein
MNQSIQILSFSIFVSVFLSACTTAKLEARLEANPQCKDVYNPKTGALMPCPGTDRSFYVAAGLEAPKQAKPTTLTSKETTSTPSTPQVSSSAATQSTIIPVVTTPAAVQSECKPTIHRKTGGMLPCPPQD